MAKNYKPRKPNQRKEKASKKTTFWQKATKYKNLIGGFFGGISLICAIVLLPKTCNEIKTTYQSQQENFEDYKFLKGIFIPMTVNGQVNFVFGSEGGISTTYTYSELVEGEGVEISAEMITMTGGAPFNLRFKIINNQLFVSGEFKDLRTKSIIGIINFNSWRLVKDKLLNYKDAYDRFEVLDQYNNVVFNMQYINNKIILNGYYFSESGQIVVVRKGLQGFGNNVDQAENSIKQIQRLFSI